MPGRLQVAEKDVDVLELRCVAPALPPSGDDARVDTGGGSGCEAVESVGDHRPRSAKVAGAELGDRLAPEGQQPP